MKTVSGDLIQLALEGKFDVIIHGCNCFCTMGAGIAKQIKSKFPAAYQADLTTIKGDKNKLGSFSFAEIRTDKKIEIVVNAYTQYHWKGSGKNADYDAIRKVFKEIKKSYAGSKIGYPAIGAGLAGGDWEIISQIKEDELEGEDHVFVEFNV